MMSSYFPQYTFKEMNFDASHLQTSRCALHEKYACVKKRALHEKYGCVKRYISHSHIFFSKWEFICYIYILLSVLSEFLAIIIDVLCLSVSIRALFAPATHSQGNGYHCNLLRYQRQKY